MILILTPDDLNRTIKQKIEIKKYEDCDIDDFQWGINYLYDYNSEGEEYLVSNRDILLPFFDTIIFQYPNEHRGMETRVLYARNS